MATSTPPTPSNPLIEFTLATDREDRGQTANYRVYAGGGQMQVKNERGETIIKNVILGGNGTIYIGNEVAGKHDAWVLIPKARYQQLTTTTTTTAPAKKGKGK